MATIANLYIDQGATFSNTITVNGADGVALNLTGYTAAAQMRKSYGSSTAYNLNAAVSNPTTGRVTITLTPSQSGDIPAGRYLYDVELTKTSDSSVIRAVEGVAIVSAQITQI